jgi:hypothetical protein
LEANISAPFEGDSFVWNPPVKGDYALEARAQVFDEFYAEWGPAYLITAVQSALPPVLQFLSPPTIIEGRFEILFSVENHHPGLVFELLRANAFGANWAIDDSATFETLIPASQFRVRTPLSGSNTTGYFRLRSN